MTNVVDKSNEEIIFKRLYIAEQDLRLINEMEPFFRKAGDYYSIVAREVNYKNGFNNGDLRAGIIKVSENSINGYELILPFSKNLVYAIIKEGMVELAFVEDQMLKTKIIPFNEEGKLNYDDYAFLLDEIDQYNLHPNSR